VEGSLTDTENGPVQAMLSYMQWETGH
jgi:hypothetical protein